MTAALIWLVLGLILIAAEVLSGEFVLLMLGGAALIAGGVSLVFAGPLVGALVFGGSALLLVFAVRPALRHRLDRGIGHQPMHTRALVGASAVVVARVDGHGGRIKIGGELWSARASDGHEVIEPGAAVTVLDISGATALVVGRD